MSREKDRKRDALKRKAENVGKLAAYGLRPEDRLMAIGVVVDQLVGGALAMEVLGSVAEFSRQATGMDLTLFPLEMGRPAMPPLCPILDAQALTDWRDPLIATSVPSCIEALATQAPIVVFYSREPEALDWLNVRDPRLLHVVSPTFDLARVVPAIVPAMRGEHAV